MFKAMASIETVSLLDDTSFSANCPRQNTAPVSSPIWSSFCPVLDAGPEQFGTVDVPFFDINLIDESRLPQIEQI